MILVTGGNGYIGSHVVVELLQANYKVIVIDDFSNSLESVSRAVSKITGSNLDVVKGSILDTDLVYKVFKNNKIEAVIHFAAKKSVSDSVKSPHKYFTANISGLINLTNVMNNMNCRNLIFSSSATVYSPNSKMPLNELSEVSPTSPYGTSKVMGEQILKDLVNHLGWDVVILRYFNPVGAHESGLIGENSTTGHSNLMPIICDVATKKLPCLNIYGNDYDTPDGTGIRDYIHVNDLSRAHIDGLNYCLENQGLEIFNVGTGNGLSVLEVITKFETVNSIHIEKIFTPRRVGDVAISYADPSKIKRKLGWQVKFNLDDMVRSSWQWYQRGLQ